VYYKDNANDTIVMVRVLLNDPFNEEIYAAPINAPGEAIYIKYNELQKTPPSEPAPRPEPAPQPNVSDPVGPSTPAPARKPQRQGEPMVDILDLINVRF